MGPSGLSVSHFPSQTSSPHLNDSLKKSAVESIHPKIRLNRTRVGASPSVTRDTVTIPNSSLLLGLTSCQHVLDTHPHLSYCRIPTGSEPPSPPTRPCSSPLPVCSLHSMVCCSILIILAPDTLDEQLHLTEIHLRVSHFYLPTTAHWNPSS